MKTLLLSPELFLSDGGIARILRSYLKALCDSSGADDEVVSIVLNDRPGRPTAAAPYGSAALGEMIGCARSKVRFTEATLSHAIGARRLVCGHLHLLPVARLAQQLNSSLRYYLVAHGIEVWRPYSQLERHALLGAERILCVSEYTLRQMRRFCPELDPRRLVVVPNTLDPFFQARRTPAPLPAPAGNPRILTVSRLSSADTYKGVDSLIEALPRLRREFPRARLRIVGGGDDQPRLQALCHHHQIVDGVDFTGRITDEALLAEYAACDLFALPSRKEGFGLVYLEAMSYGKACLAARSGGAPEVITDEVGALCDYGNTAEIAAAITDLVRFPRDPSHIRAHADTFAYPVFRRKLADALTGAPA